MRKRLTISLIILTGLLVFGYFMARGVFGGAFINLTLTTNPDLENGLVGHWTFDGSDIQTQITDESGQGNDAFFGTTTSATSTMLVSGNIGQGIILDGMDDYVDLSSVSGIPAQKEPITVAAWINSDNTDVDLNVVSRWDDSDGDGGAHYDWLFDAHRFDIHTDTSDQIWSASTSISVIPGGWHHSVAVYAGGTDVKFYLDGTLVGTGAWLGWTSASTIGNVVTLGAAQNDDGRVRFWPGQLDDVRIYDRALSAAEVKRLYELGATTKVNKTITTNPDLENGLVGHWSFDGADIIDQVTDQSGNGNDGYFSTTSQATSSMVVPGKFGQAVRFDGVDDYIQIDSALGITDYPYTLAGWTNTVGDSEAGIVFFGDSTSPRDYSSIGMNGSLFFGLQARDAPAPDILNSPVAPDGKWHHVVGVYRSSTDREIFVDGVSYGTDSDPIAYPGPDVVSIGAFQDTTPGDFLTGAIDDVRVYNRALSAEEVKRLYELGN